jgi:hypothetical protein
MGLVFAGALSVLQAAQVSMLQLATTLVALACLVFTKIGPYPLMIAAALIFGSLQFV